VSQSSEFADVTLCVASQRVFVVVGVVVVYFVIDSVRKLLVTPWYYESVIPMCYEIVIRWEGVDWMHLTQDGLL